MIEESLSDLGQQIRFCSEPATVSNVRKRLDKGCKILYYTGHGCSENLSFEDGEARRCGIVENLNVRIIAASFKSRWPTPEPTWCTRARPPLTLVPPHRANIDLRAQYDTRF